MIVAVPPEPVAAFSDQYFFARPLDGSGLHTGGRLQRLAGVGQLTPRLLIVGVPDPDIEVRVDPRPRKNTREIVPRVPAGFGHGDCPKLRMPGETAVKGTQERAPAALEVLPGV